MRVCALDSDQPRENVENWMKEKKMRHLPVILGAAVLSVCLFGSSGQASAAPLLPLSASSDAASQLEKVGYYRRGYRRGYGHRYWGGPYWRPYGYYGYYGRPYWYGYGYRPYRRYGWGY